ncbi:MAG: PEGA domain-containing protein [Patescibacteria group bacterium]
MRKIKIALISLGVIGLLLSITLFLIGYFKPKKAAIFIDSTPSSLVFINGEQIGRTPYQGSHNPGEITLKLVPDALQEPLSPYETKVGLTSGIKTIVRRYFGSSEDINSGEIISFEKTGLADASLSVVSNPDAAQVSLDGQVRGFTPIKISPVSPGKHELRLDATNYEGRSFPVGTQDGYLLTAAVKLASSPKQEPSPVPEVLSESKIVGKIEISDTPTGFLRVRESPFVSSIEVGKVKPGEIFEILEEDEKSGWFKIEFLPAQTGEKGKEGWVSNQYATKVLP